MLKHIINKTQALVLFAGLVLSVSIALNIPARAEDKTDHPLLSHIEGTTLLSKTVRQFSVLKVSPAGKMVAGQPDSFEGKMTTIDYGTINGPPPGEVMIYRNYLAAAQKLGGRQLNEGFDANDSISLVTGAHVFTLSSAEPPPIVVLNITNAYNYSLTIIEPKAMTQSVQAGQLASDIKSKGFATLHINFDTNKSDLMADGVAAVNEIAKLLKTEPALRLSIDGYTDNTGNAAANLALSQARARAVMEAVIAQGINAQRLHSQGFGVAHPVATNETEPGRAQNRRVELVKTP